VKPRLHVFGHIHWRAGRESVYFDDCQRAYEALIERPKPGLLRDILPHAGWIDAGRVIANGVHSVLWKWLMLGPGGNNGSVMVNAGVMYGNTGKIGNRPQVVLL
jgi:hypothetical protein